MTTYFIVQYRHVDAKKWYYLTGHGQSQPKLWTPGLAKNRAESLSGRPDYVVNLIQVDLPDEVNDELVR